MTETLEKQTKTDAVDWTPEQRDAFEDRGHNLLVSASAGSGKTTVMIKRIVDLILLDNIPVSSFLVVTFTKASASDMKKKLVDALLKNQNNPFAVEQIENVETSDICNLHSFCSRLISTYFYEVGIDPSYHIIDDIESVFLKDKALTKLFEIKQKENDFEFFELFDIFQKKRSDKQLREIIKTFSNYLNSHIDGTAWFNEKIEQSHDLNLNKNSCANLINNYVCNAILEDSEMLENFASKCLDAGEVKLHDYFVDMASSLKTINKRNLFEVNAKNIYEIELGRTPTVSGEAKFLSEEAKNLRAEIKNDIDNFKENFVSNDMSVLYEGLKVSKQRLVSLFELTCHFNEIYSALKKEVNGLDFNDLEKYALQILDNASILQTVKQKYKYVFVDEYQDINNVQEKIISLVSGDNNRFMVGDVKQSIYRFRLCDPDIFLQKYDIYGNGKDNGKLIKLNCNFRSDKKILKFVDQVFCDVMTESFGEVDYKKDAQFIAGKNNLDGENSVNLCFIDSSKQKQEKPQVSGVYSVQNHEQEESEETMSAIAEARFVADKIAELVNPLNENKINYGDIAILVGSRNEAVSKFIETLQAFGIPVSSDEKHNLMERKHIKEIVNFVNLLCNEKDDFVLFKVLKSRLFNFSDEEIIQIRKVNHSLRFFDCITNFESLENENLKEKISQFLQKVNQFKNFSKIMGVKQLIEKIVEYFALDKINLTERCGEQYNAEIDKFVQTIPNVDAFEFVLNYSNLAIEYENESGGDAVKLMTIHKSKGIEFKAVFLINTTNGFNFKSTQGSILFNKHFGVGMDFFDTATRSQISTLAISAIKMLERRKLVEEQQRVLYVALTRAIQKMYIVCTKPREKIKEFFVNRPTSFSCWFEPFIYSEINGKHSEIINFEEYHLSELLCTLNAQEKQILFTEKTPEKVDWFKYKYASETVIPLKNSISKILTNSQEKNDDYEDKLVFFEDNISSADRGTAYHKLFQNINLKKLDEIDSQIENAKMFFDKDEWNLIDVNIVKNVLKHQFFYEIEQNDTIFQEREFYAKMPATIVDKTASESDEFVLQGVVDLLVIKQNEMFILDYKTGKIDDEKLKKYEFQISTYASVCERIFNKKITKKLLCFVDLQKIIEI